jgi:hypothetical protein
MLRNRKAGENMRLMRLLCYSLIAGAAVFVLAAMPIPADAGIGVGVDLGEIKIDEVLTPGNVYHLPTIGVINTGDQPADYEVVVTYLNGQQEMMPSADWFQFEPERFTMEPGTSKRVATSLHIPRGATPGDYFALIEAHPVVDASGGTSIAIGAATKLRFSVKGVNTAVSVLDAIGDFFGNFSPYSYIMLGLVGGFTVYLAGRRFFRIKFRLERR